MILKWLNTKGKKNLYNKLPFRFSCESVLEVDGCREQELPVVAAVVSDVSDRHNSAEAVKAPFKMLCAWFTIRLWNFFVFSLH